MARGWRCIIGTYIGCMTMVGSYMLLSVFLIPLTQKYGIGMGAASLLFTFNGIGSLLANFFGGSLIEKIHPKYMYILGALCLLQFYLLAAFSGNIMVLYVSSIFYGVGVVFSGYLPAMALISRWVDKGRGTLLSLPSVMVNLFVVVMSPIMTSLLSKYDFADLMLYFGLIACGIIIIVALFFISRMPSHYGIGQISIGKNNPNEGNKDKPVNLNQDANTSLPVREISKLPQFYFVLISAVFLTFSSVLFSSNAIPYFTTIGLSQADAAYAFSIYNLIRIAVIFLFGVLCDRIGPAKTIAIYGVVGGCVLFFNGFMQGLAGAVIVSLAAGVAPIAGVVGSNMFPKMFGAKNSSQLIGYSHVACSIGSMVGPPFAGFIFDSLGSYTVALITAGAFILFAGLLAHAAGSKKSLERIKVADDQYLATLKPE